MRTAAAAKLLDGYTPGHVAGILLPTSLVRYLCLTLPRCCRPVNSEPDATTLADGHLKELSCRAVKHRH